MEEHYKNRTLGIVLAVIGAILGVGLNLVIFFTQYQLMIQAQIDTYGPITTNQYIIGYILPVFAGCGSLAGVMYAIGAYGFIKKTDDPYKISMVANVIALLFSFWPMIPAMDTGLTPYYVFVFLPNCLIYLLLNLLVGKKRFGRVALGLITGMAMVMTYINGTASLNQFWKEGPLFQRVGGLYLIISNPVHYCVMISFGIVTIAMLLSPKKWVRILAIVAGIVEIGMGTPMGIITTIIKGEFSMYLAGPLMSILIIIVAAVPFLWEKIVKPEQRGT